MNEARSPSDLILLVSKGYHASIDRNSYIQTERPDQTYFDALVDGTGPHPHHKD